jgi:PAS domain S-box-containing protein
MSFRTKTILGIAVIEAVLLLLLIWNSLNFLYDSSEQALVERAQTMASLFASTTKDAVLAYDLASLESHVEELLTNTGVLFVRVRTNNRVLAEAGSAPMLARNFTADQTLEKVDDDVFDIAHEIREAGIRYGQVELGLSVTGIRQTLSNARTETAAIAALEMVLVALFSFVLGTYLTRQLLRLSEASKLIANGGAGVQIDVVGDDELADTSRAFNVMSARLRESYDQLHFSYRNIMTSVSDGIITLTQSGLVTDCNAAAERIFAAQVNDVVSAPITVLLPPPFDFKQHIGSRIEVDCTNQQGDPITLDISISEIVVSDGETVHTLIIRDMTERKRFEAQLQETAKRLEHQNALLQEFAYVASHDLQEPLRKVRTYGDMLHEECADKLSPDALTYVVRMQDSAERMQGLITDLLAYSRIATRQESYNEVCLDEILDDVLNDLEVAIDEASATVERQPLPVIKVDRSQMRQVLQNLFSNALKFRAPDQPANISISAEPATLPRIDQRGTVAACRIVVEDNGIGFESEFASRIFDVFERLNPRHHYPGTGIGLAICRKIIERHGGEISASSTPGEGARFEILLPLNPPKDIT